MTIFFENSSYQVRDIVVQQQASGQASLGPSCQLFLVRQCRFNVCLSKARVFPNNHLWQEASFVKSQNSLRGDTRACDHHAL